MSERQQKKTRIAKFFFCSLQWIMIYFSISPSSISCIWSIETNWWIFQMKKKSIDWFIGFFFFSLFLNNSFIYSSIRFNIFNWWILIFLNKHIDSRKSFSFFFIVCVYTLFSPSKWLIEFDSGFIWKHSKEREREKWQI